MRYQLFLCLLSPVEELFPDLGMSWWTPPNLRLERYARVWPGRVASILTVWTPILSVVAQLMTSPASPIITSCLTVAIFTAFGIRLYVLGKKLDKIFASTTYIALQQSKHETPETKNTDKTSDLVEVKSAFFCFPPGSLEVRQLLKSTDGCPVSVGGLSFDFLEVAEMLYFVVFSSISVIIYTALDDVKWLAFFAVGLILFGAFFMAQFRHRHQLLDVFGRVVFTAGFLTNLYNLNRADNKLS
mmetsp:Transcript_37709/g.82030  ORF Transcript_37709/g.82030 Transcript_37709/m.82030 type:complete len:243 (+) Transcript_37709:240-968(+)|eukprot:CAMPEP_0118937216 /NCGR_PEP_ID=MMETSP1169-20130426/22000_1 /TAXON_ID=36882 /ORGANISM="Pyramimonas obovata, Strain CCMP722" /LENGTH=242 /DNA_ID=CAMNT_0006880789 /DNA_START=193 /DNA_END=921 /DNA_ORIENTATION=+